MIELLYSHTFDTTESCNLHVQDELIIMSYRTDVLMSKFSLNI